MDCPAKQLPAECTPSRLTALQQIAESGTTVALPRAFVLDCDLEFRVHAEWQEDRPL